MSTNGNIPRLTHTESHVDAGGGVAPFLFMLNTQYGVCTYAVHLPACFTSETEVILTTLPSAVQLELEQAVYNHPFWGTLNQTVNNYLFRGFAREFGDYASEYATYHSILCLPDLYEPYRSYILYKMAWQHMLRLDIVFKPCSLSYISLYRNLNLLFSKILMAWFNK